MSDAPVSVVMERIEAATRHSPILVMFSNKLDCVNAVFAGTVESQKLIKRKDPRVIGVFHQEMSMSWIRDKLRRCAYAG